jgi:hypothetical protein
MKCTEPFPMKTTHDSIEQTTTRCCTKKARKDDRITLAKYYVDEIYGDKMGVACIHPKAMRNAHKKLVGRDHLEDLNVGGRAIVKLHWSK